MLNYKMYTHEFCIPRVKNSYSNKYIEHVFAKLGIGKIEKVICLPLKHDDTCKRIIIKMNVTPIQQTETLLYIADEIANNKYFKLVHGFPDYWRVYVNLPQTRR